MYPQILANRIPIINVGSVDQYGATDLDSQGGPLLTVLAPGKHVCCAGRTGNNERQVSGTSAAAAAVAGLAAYLFSVEKYQSHLRELDSQGRVDVSKYPQKMKDLIKLLAYRRQYGSGDCIYNAVEWIDPTSCPLNVSPQPHKRQACCKLRELPQLGTGSHCY